jgi:hypothetical protein
MKSQIGKNARSALLQVKIHDPTSPWAAVGFVVRPAAASLRGEK